MRKTIVFFLGFLFGVAGYAGYFWFQVPFEKSVIILLGALVVMLVGMVGITADE